MDPTAADDGLKKRPEGIFVFGLLTVLRWVPSPADPVISMEGEVL
jgi:hypothetical protein